jgi:UDP-MurNAc hydroxylase
MQITYLGHAGLFIETAAGSILCDPWFNPAFFGSWYPFPSNESIDFARIATPDYLYISHEHRDHLDHRFLREHVSKSARVLLPDYPIGSLERELRTLGFSKFVRTRNLVPMPQGGLTIAIAALVTPSDGPEGDSGLIVDDGHHRIFNQNDSRPVDMSALQRFGPFDAHFLQFSGAIWYPMVYRFDRETKAELGRRKRLNQQARALDFARQLDAAHVFPSAGPPCFLDDDLYGLNDFNNDPANIFCDQTMFLDYMQANGCDRGHLIIPNSVITLDGPGCAVAHTLPDAAISAIFTDKRAYLDEYQRRKRDTIAAERAAWPTVQSNLLNRLAARLEPLLKIADLTCAGIDERILLNAGDEAIVIDFLTRRVYASTGEPCAYRFWVDRRLLAHCVDHESDWVNSLFLSCRFEAERDGPYNEYVYNFFKCLTLERLQYAEGYYAEVSNSEEMFELGDYLVQRRCPHLKADLSRFAHLEGNVLTCSMHGWQFDVETGECLTSSDRRLNSRRIRGAAVGD